MAISRYDDPWHYQKMMEEKLWRKQQEMEHRMRQIQGYYGQPFVPVPDTVPETPKKPKHLNPKLLLTRG